MPVITQCDILNDGGSGIIQCACILHLELLLTEEFFNKLTEQMKDFLQQLYAKLVQLNPEIVEMDLDSEENVQFLDKIRV